MTIKYQVIIVVQYGFNHGSVNITELIEYCSTSNGWYSENNCTNTISEIL